MSPKMLEDAFNGAKQMYDAGNISKSDYLKVLNTIDTGKIDLSIPENTTRKQELDTLISNEISLISLV